MMSITKMVPAENIHCFTNINSPSCQPTCHDEYVMLCQKKGTTYILTTNLNVI
uniref:Uncharacterized protein n=1 Tax=Arion vulgaris TaxID=1028688 RepID=A0A0B7B541_9EUPU